MLGFVNQNGIAGSYDATTGVLTLIGVSNLANYQAALRSVTYANASDNPSDVARTISFKVDDGGGLASLGDATMTFTTVNDASGERRAGFVRRRGDTDAALGGLSITDVDANSGTFTTTLSVAHGTLTVAAAGGAMVDGSGTGSVTLSGTLAQINAPLAAAGSIVYRGAQDFFGDDTLTLATDDGGSTGSAARSSTATRRRSTSIPGSPAHRATTASRCARQRADRRARRQRHDHLRLPPGRRDDHLSGNEVIIDGPSSHTVLTGFEKFVFTDGTVDNR